MDQVRERFSRFEKAPSIPTKQKVVKSLESLVQMTHSPPDIEAMRAYLILPECHFFDQPKFYSSLLTPFGKSILNLEKAAAKFLGMIQLVYHSVEGCYNTTGTNIATGYRDNKF